MWNKCRLSTAPTLRWGKMFLAIIRLELLELLQSPIYRRCIQISQLLSNTLSNTYTVSFTNSVKNIRNRAHLRVCYTNKDWYLVAQLFKDATSSGSVNDITSSYVAPTATFPTRQEAHSDHRTNFNLVNWISFPLIFFFNSVFSATGLLQIYCSPWATPGFTWFDFPYEAFWFSGAGPNFITIFWDMSIVGINMEAQKTASFFNFIVKIGNILSRHVWWYHPWK